MRQYRIHSLPSPPQKTLKSRLALKTLEMSHSLSWSRRGKIGHQVKVKPGSEEENDFLFYFISFFGSRSFWLKRRKDGKKCAMKSGESNGKYSSTTKVTYYWNLTDSIR